MCLEVFVIIIFFLILFVPLYFFLSIINSKVMIFYIKQKYSSSSYNGGINFSKDMINQLPMKLIDENTKKKMIDYVDKILEFKMTDPLADTSSIEYDIDKMVYEIFELNNDEIKVIEEAR